MSYTTLRTRHSVGDTVYFHDEEIDAVCRAIVVGIEATCEQPGYAPEFKVLYRVASKWATDPAKTVMHLKEENLHGSADEAFPRAPPDVIEPPPTYSQAPLAHDFDEAPL